MRYNYNKTISLLIVLMLLISANATAQLNSFVLTVTSIDESCPANGSLSFSATGMAPGANVIYNIYQLPNVTTPVATTAGNTLGGLSAGIYRVVAIQSVGQQSSSQQQDIEIQNTYIPLSYQIVASGCAGGASISITTTSGNATSYEVIAGPVTFSEQASPVFNGLPNGNYQIRVFDACGEGVVQSYTLIRPIGGISIGPGMTSGAALSSCDSISTQNSLTALPGATILYPLTLEYTIYPPSGAPVVNVQTLASGGNSATAIQIIPFYHDQLYHYNLKVTDACGNIFQLNNNQINEKVRVILSYVVQNCSRGLSITPTRHAAPYSVSFISAPSGFDPVVFNVAHPGTFSSPAVYFNPSTPMPAGIYEVQITDSCGRTATNQINFNPTVPVNPVTFNYIAACGDAPGTISGQSPNGALQTVIVTSAPDSYPHDLPHNVSHLIAGTQFSMNSVLPGEYVFQTVDICNNSVTVTVNANPNISVSSNVEVTERCNSFELFVSHSGTSGGYEYYLQKYNSTNAQWVHPVTGVIADDAPTVVNSLLLPSNTPIINLTYFGSFRILRKQLGSGPAESCVQVIHSFEFDGNPAVNAIYAFACASQSYDVWVDASGAGPLLYRITSQNGLPFSVQNGTSNVFHDLSPAIYNFQIEDTCGNILNQPYDVTENFVFPITATQMCDGAAASLSVPGFEFFEYKWWKNDDESIVLSNSPTLSFNPLDFPADAGTYHVRITLANDLASCIDYVVAYEMVAPEVPNAGGSNTIAFCGNPGNQNLYELLQGAYDLGGIWTETNNADVIQDGLWDSSGAGPGNHEFTYTVQGDCGSSDVAEITITLNESPPIPVAFSGSIACENSDLHLFADGSAEYQYEWTGPNGFSSTVQNPVIENVSATESGVYTVTAMINGCESEPASVEIQVFANPVFSVERLCFDGEFILHANAAGSDFEADTTFEWHGPQNFTATGNPVQITGLASGTYTLLVTLPQGCTGEAEVVVDGTICKIPKGVSANNDGQNDTFNLAGLNVEHLQIFNRYGMVVFEQQRYLNEWHGQDLKGNELPAATYYYYVRLETGTEKTGWVYLIRD